jgi:transcriptional regulator
MYVPEVFAEHNLTTLHAFIDQHSFALLCSADQGRPFASHLPLLLDRAAGPRGTLLGHMARANPQWRHADGQPVLAIFAGPHAYISPAWYEAAEVIPTWNYVAVHAVGTLRAVHDPGELLPLLDRTVAFFEGARPRPWQLQGSHAFLDRLVRAIVGFRIEIDALEGKWKLSQNHPAERREKVIRALQAQGGEDAEAVALLMHHRAS